MGGTWSDVALVVVANQGGQLSVFLLAINGTLYRYDQAASGGLGVAPVDGWDVAVGRGGQPKWPAERVRGQLSEPDVVPLRPGRVRGLGVAPVDGWDVAV